MAWKWIIIVCFVFLVYFTICGCNNSHEYFSNQGNNVGSNATVSSAGTFEGVDAIYWINMDRAESRRKKMETEILKDESLGRIPNERIVGFDAEKSDYSRYLKGVNADKPKGVYGCLLSHLRAIKKVANSKHECVLIMEDDISMEYKPHWKYTLKECIEEAPSDWEIIQLGIIPGSTYEYIPNVKIRETRPREVWSTISYIIKKSAAEKLINDIYNPNMDQFNIGKDAESHPADIFLYEKLKSYHCSYPYFTYPDNNDSYIADNIFETQHKYPKKIMSDIIMK